MKYRPDPNEAPSSSFGATSYYKMRGRTAGLLGYGAIARETARLLQAFGIKVIAANSRGERRVDDGVSRAHPGVQLGCTRAEIFRMEGS